MKTAQQALQDARAEPTTQEIYTAEDDYLSRVGEMETASESSYTEHLLEHLATNFASPIQSVEQSNGDVYYGVISYTEGDEWYGFYAYDARSVGRRVIGLQNTADIEYDTEVLHASAGDPTGSFADTPSASYQELSQAIKDVYDEQLGTDRPMPETIERLSFTVPRTRNTFSGPKEARQQGRQRAEQVASENRPDNPGNQNT